MFSPKSHKVTKMPSRVDGFTLLEILVAIFIFAIIVTTIFGSFHSVFSNTEAISRDSALYEMGRNCVNRMVADLSSAHVALLPVYQTPTTDQEPDPYRLVGEQLSVGDAEFSRLRFASHAHVSFAVPARQGIAQIVYYIQIGENKSFILRRADRLYPFPEFEENNGDPVLCRSVRKLRFMFYDRKKSEFEQWDSEAEAFEWTTPVAVKIQLVVGDEEMNHRFETTVNLPVVRELPTKG